jgi:hypothetical protein
VPKALCDQVVRISGQTFFRRLRPERFFDICIQGKLKLNCNFELSLKRPFACQGREEHKKRVSVITI